MRVDIVTTSTLDEIADKTVMRTIKNLFEYTKEQTNKFEVEDIEISEE